MAEFPFHIPKSLATYIEQFDDDPVKVTTKLKKHLEKRGPDAVGYFLLAWFYHQKGVKKEAIVNALKAKTYAPGSPLMERLHYYLLHPATFEAWDPPASTAQTRQKYGNQNGPEPVLNLDQLIARLSEVDSTPISISESNIDTSEKNKIKVDIDIDDIASETLAKIHKEQGKLKEAIHTYKRLLKLDGNKERKKYYEEQISLLEENLKKD